jgi:hypothetical protein
MAGSRARPIAALRKVSLTLRACRPRPRGRLTSCVTRLSGWCGQASASCRADTGSSPPGRAPCDAATYPRVVRERRDDRRTRYVGAAQSNGAAQKIDEQVTTESCGLQPTQRWTDGEITAFAPPSPGYCKIKMSALLGAGFRLRIRVSSTDQARVIDQRNCASCTSRALDLIRRKEVAQIACSHTPCVWRP